MRPPGTAPLAVDDEVATIIVEPADVAVALLEGELPVVVPLVSAWNAFVGAWNAFVGA